MGVQDVIKQEVVMFCLCVLFSLQTDGFIDLYNILAQTNREGKILFCISGDKCLVCCWAFWQRQVPQRDNACNFVYLKQTACLT